jgi:c-di-GMP-binding flagellar brake protein YcgR
MAGRRAKRIQATEKIPVGFLSANIRFSGALVDLSTTGMLVRTSHLLEPGTVGRIGIDVGDETLRIVVSVRRNVPSVGVAFEFMQMTQQDRVLMHRLSLRLQRPIGS